MDNQHGRLDLLVEMTVAILAFLLFATGGSLGGKTVIDGDDESPPVAAEQNAD